MVLYEKIGGSGGGKTIQEILFFEKSRGWRLWESQGGGLAPRRLMDRPMPPAGRV